MLKFDKETCFINEINTSFFIGFCLTHDWYLKMTFRLKKLSINDNDKSYQFDLATLGLFRLFYLVFSFFEKEENQVKEQA
jgi:hypothetical protein